MTKEEFYPQETTARGHSRNAKEAFNGDITKVLIELITNSCDSYKREKNQSDNKKKIIQINYEVNKRIISVLDNGEGINYYKKGDEKSFRDIMKKGEKTSGVEKGIAVRGFHGIGLKDVCISVSSSSNNFVELVSIRENKISILNYGFNKELNNYGDWPKSKDEKVTSTDRKKYGIKENGFYIRFKVPKDFNLPEFGKLKTKLETHRELRKILEIGEIQIYLNKEKLNYDLVEGKVVDSGKFYITWKKTEFKIDYIIKLAEVELAQTAAAWRDRIGGILIYYNKDAVLDLNLFKFNNNPYAAKIFGEAKISAEKLDQIGELLEEGLVFEKRWGLNEKKEFNKKLIDILEKKLQIIVDKEKGKGKDKN